MDRELAEAVFFRFSQGEPVYEGTLYKAASVLGADPQGVLNEARFYHHLDRALERGTPFTQPEREYFSVAAGFDPFSMEKTAEAYGFESPDRLIIRALQRTNFLPDIEKLAMMGMAAGPSDAAMGMGDDAAAGMDPAMMQDPSAGAPPQPGAQLQQNPMVRPSPTAPAQVPSSPGGNLQDLLGQAGETPGAGDNGGLPPAGAGADGAPPQPVPPEQRLQQAMPDIPPDAVERYAPLLTEFEQAVGMTMMDPKQVEKFIKEMQKNDKKIIDEQMKVFAEEQAKKMGLGGSGSGSWDATAPQPNGGGGGMGGGAPGGAPGDGAGGGGEMPGGAPGGPPEPPPQAAGPGAGGGLGGPPKPKKPQPPQGSGEQPPAGPNAMTKAASAGVALARANRR